MSFTRAQHGHFRRMVGFAWVQFLNDFPDAQKCRKQQRCGACDFCTWYEGALMEATGKRSTSDCNHTQDFNLAMAQFEILAGAGIYWSVRQQNADKIRVLWLLRDYANNQGFNEAYLEAIARRPFEKRRCHFPGIDALTVEDLVKVLGALKRQALRKAKAAAATTKEADPF